MLLQNQLELSSLLDGKDIKEDQYEFDGGRVVLKVGSGSVGPHSITGKLIYLQDGNEVEVLVDKQFTTINKPKSASIRRLTKMNVVYRGVSNPMTITFAGSPRQSSIRQVPLDYLNRKVVMILIAQQARSLFHIYLLLEVVVV